MASRHRPPDSDQPDLSSVRVFVRVRPPTKQEILGKAPTIVTVPDTSTGESGRFGVGQVIQIGERTGPSGTRLAPKSFSFNGAYDGNAANAAVFSNVESSVASATDGINATIFAYGQTGTGKTHTMLGAGVEESLRNGIVPGQQQSSNSTIDRAAGMPSRTSVTDSLPESWGLIPRAVTLLLWNLANKAGVSPSLEQHQSHDNEPEQSNFASARAEPAVADAPAAVTQQSLLNVRLPRYVGGTSGNKNGNKRGRSGNGIRPPATSIAAAADSPSASQVSMAADTSRGAPGPLSSASAQQEQPEPAPTKAARKAGSFRLSPTSMSDQPISNALERQDSSGNLNAASRAPALGPGTSVLAGGAVQQDGAQPSLPVIDGAGDANASNPDTDRVGAAAAATSSTERSDSGAAALPPIAINIAAANAASDIPRPSTSEDRAPPPQQSPRVRVAMHVSYLQIYNDKVYDLLADPFSKPNANAANEIVQPPPDNSNSSGGEGGVSTVAGSGSFWDLSSTGSNSGSGAYSPSNNAVSFGGEKPSLPPPGATIWDRPLTIREGKLPPSTSSAGNRSSADTPNVDNDTDDLSPAAAANGTSVHVVGLSVHQVYCLADVMRLLQRGATQRAVRPTDYNDTSSRSHAVLQITVITETELQDDAGGDASKPGTAQATSTRHNSSSAAAANGSSRPSTTNIPGKTKLHISRQVIRRSAKLNLVDLAGSEKWNMSSAPGSTSGSSFYINTGGSLEFNGTGGSSTSSDVAAALSQMGIASSSSFGLRSASSSVADKDRAREHIAINKSLSALGNCIAALAAASSDSAGSSTKRGIHVPYRDSALTRLLRDSLGGNTRTTVIATISPLESAIDETLSTLYFAERARMVVSKVRVNEEVSDTILLQRARNEISRLRKELEAYRRLDAIIANKLGPQLGVVLGDNGSKLDISAIDIADIDNMAAGIGDGDTSAAFDELNSSIAAAPAPMNASRAASGANARNAAAASNQSASEQVLAGSAINDDDDMIALLNNKSQVVGRDVRGSDVADWDGAASATSSHQQQHQKQQARSVMKGTGAHHASNNAKRTGGGYIVPSNHSNNSNNASAVSKQHPTARSKVNSLGGGASQTPPSRKHSIAASTPNPSSSVARRPSAVTSQTSASQNVQHKPLPSSLVKSPYNRPFSLSPQHESFTTAGSYAAASTVTVADRKLPLAHGGAFVHPYPANSSVMTNGAQAAADVFGDSDDRSRQGGSAMGNAAAGSSGSVPLASGRKSLGKIRYLEDGEDGAELDVTAIELSASPQAPSQKQHQQRRHPTASSLTASPTAVPRQRPSPPAVPKPIILEFDAASPSMFSSRGVKAGDVDGVRAAFASNPYAAALPLQPATVHLSAVDQKSLDGMSAASSSAASRADAAASVRKAYLERVYGLSASAGPASSLPSSTMVVNGSTGTINGLPPASSAAAPGSASALNTPVSPTFAAATAFPADASLLPGATVLSSARGSSLPQQQQVNMYQRYAPQPQSKPLVADASLLSAASTGRVTVSTHRGNIVFQSPPAASAQHASSMDPDDPQLSPKSAATSVQGSSGDNAAQPQPILPRPPASPIHISMSVHSSAPSSASTGSRKSQYALAAAMAGPASAVQTGTSTMRVSSGQVFSIPRADAEQAVGVGSHGYSTGPTSVVVSGSASIRSGSITSHKPPAAPGGKARSRRSSASTAASSVASPLLAPPHLASSINAKMQERAFVLGHDSNDGWAQLEAANASASAAIAATERVLRRHNRSTATEPAASKPGPVDFVIRSLQKVAADDLTVALAKTTGVHDPSSRAFHAVTSSSAASSSSPSRPSVQTESSLGTAGSHPAASGSDDKFTVAANKGRIIVPPYVNEEEERRNQEMDSRVQRVLQGGGGAGPTPTPASASAAAAATSSAPPASDGAQAEHETTVDGDEGNVYPPTNTAEQAQNHNGGIPGGPSSGGATALGNDRTGNTSMDKRDTYYDRIQGQHNKGTASAIELGTSAAEGHPGPLQPPAKTENVAILGAMAEHLSAGHNIVQQQQQLPLAGAYASKTATSTPSLPRSRGSPAIASATPNSKHSLASESCNSTPSTKHSKGMFQESVAIGRLLEHKLASESMAMLASKVHLAAGTSIVGGGGLASGRTSVDWSNDVNAQRADTSPASRFAPLPSGATTDRNVAAGGADAAPSGGPFQFSLGLGPGSSTSSPAHSLPVTRAGTALGNVFANADTSPAGTAFVNQFSMMTQSFQSLQPTASDGTLMPSAGAPVASKAVFRGHRRSSIGGFMTPGTGSAGNSAGGINGGSLLPSRGRASGTPGPFGFGAGGNGYDSKGTTSLVGSRAGSPTAGTAPSSAVSSPSPLVQQQRAPGGAGYSPVPGTGQQSASSSASSASGVHHQLAHRTAAASSPDRWHSPISETAHLVAKGSVVAGANATAALAPTTSSYSPGLASTGQFNPSAGIASGARRASITNALAPLGRMGLSSPPQPATPGSQQSNVAVPDGPVGSDASRALALLRSVTGAGGNADLRPTTAAMFGERSNDQGGLGGTSRNSPAAGRTSRDHSANSSPKPTAGMRRGSNGTTLLGKSLLPADVQMLPDQEVPAIPRGPVGDPNSAHYHAESLAAVNQRAAIRATSTQPPSGRSSAALGPDVNEIAGSPMHVLAGLGQRERGTVGAEHGRRGSSQHIKPALDDTSLVAAEKEALRAMARQRRSSAVGIADFGRSIEHVKSRALGHLSEADELVNALRAEEHLRTASIGLMTGTDLPHSRSPVEQRSSRQQSSDGRLRRGSQPGFGAAGALPSTRKALVEVSDVASALRELDFDHAEPGSASHSAVSQAVDEVASRISTFLESRKRAGHEAGSSSNVLEAASLADIAAAQAKLAILTPHSAGNSQKSTPRGSTTDDRTPLDIAAVRARAYQHIHPTKPEVESGSSTPSTSDLLRLYSSVASHVTTATQVQAATLARATAHLHRTAEESSHMAAAAAATIPRTGGKIRWEDSPSLPHNQIHYNSEIGRGVGHPQPHHGHGPLGSPGFPPAHQYPGHASPPTFRNGQATASPATSGRVPSPVHGARHKYADYVPPPHAVQLDTEPLGYQYTNIALAAAASAIGGASVSGHGTLSSVGDYSYGSPAQQQQDVSARRRRASSTLMSLSPATAHFLNHHSHGSPGSVVSSHFPPYSHYSFASAHTTIDGQPSVVSLPTSLMSQAGSAVLQRSSVPSVAGSLPSKAQARQRSCENGAQKSKALVAAGAVPHAHSNRLGSRSVITTKPTKR